jgi:hypothetical protein
MALSDRTLLRLHVEAVWGVRLPAPLLEDTDLLIDGVRPDWRLCAADLAQGRICIWRPDVPATERAALRGRVSETLAFPPDGAELTGVHREVALAQAADPRIDAATARAVACPLSDADRAQVEAFEPGECDYYYDPRRRPLIGALVAGQILSIAHSSRRTAEACELGVFTLCEARRKGFALAVTVMWTRAVVREGLLPLYSADASNAASLRLADAAGYQAFARLATFD